MKKKSSVTILLIIVLSVGLLFGLNLLTKDKIAENGSLAEFEPLLKVMPDASGFECIYSEDNAAASALKDVPDSVIAIYKETEGKGYALSLSAIDGYTKETMYVTMAVDSEGKICGLNIDTLSCTDGKKGDVTACVPSYLGQDSALGGVSLASGATYSSTALKTAVEDGFTALIANELVGAGQKGDDQILMELLPSVYSGAVNADGVAQLEEFEFSGSYVVKAMKVTSDFGSVYIAKDGDTSLLVIMNYCGAVKAYDVEGKDVTASLKQEIIDEVKTAASGLGTPDISFQLRKLTAMFGDGAGITEITDHEVFSTVSNVYTLKANGKDCYAFVSHPFGWSNMAMTFYYVIDMDGSIAAMNADNFIIEPEYCPEYSLDETAYKAGLIGVTAETVNDDMFLISGATMTANASRIAAHDSFAAFDIIMNGGENNA